MNIRVISFGYAHDRAPAGHLVVDVRKHFRDPHVNPALRELTAADPAVRAAVLGTPGVADLIQAVTCAASAFGKAPVQRPLTIAIGCVGGRHRSAVIAAEIARALDGVLIHRDIDKPVVERQIEQVLA